VLVAHHAEQVPEGVHIRCGHEPGPRSTGPLAVRVQVGAPTALDIARTLAGWGSAVEVLDPPAVHAELARIGAELALRYGASTA
jgi:hypothetical protein